jgi:hypothetical protein
MGLIKITAADKWFSLCVRERAAWKCEYPGCGKHYPPPTTALHCCHYHSRGNWFTRFDPSNAAAMCYGHHEWTARNREDCHTPMMRALIGEIELDRLAFDRNRPAYGIKKRVGEIAKFYREELKKMQALRAQGHTGRIDFEPWSV